MKMFYLVGVIAFASLLAFVGCSTGTDPDANPGDDPAATIPSDDDPAATIPASLSDAQKSATDQSVELLEEVEEKIVANADSLAENTDVVFSVNDKDVASTITSVGAASVASGGRSIPAAAETPVAETPVKVVEFAFKEGEEIKGTQTVTTYKDGSWDMEGAATFQDIADIEAKDPDGNPLIKPIKIEYKKTKVDKDGKISGGNILVDDTEIETKAFNALKKIAVFYKKLNKKLLATHPGGAPDPPGVMDITTTSSVLNVKKDGEAVSQTFETYREMMKDSEIGPHWFQLRTGYKTMLEMMGGGSPTFLDGSFEWTDKSVITMDAKENAGFTYTFSMVNEATISAISSLEDGETTMTLRTSSTLKINAEIDGMSIAFTNVKMASEVSMVLPHNEVMDATKSVSEDEERFRWSGTITVDGTTIDVSEAKMDVLSKLLSMGKSQVANPADGSGEGSLPEGR